MSASPPRPPSLTTKVEIVVDPKTGEARQAGSDRGGEFITNLRLHAENSLYVFGKVVMGYDLLTPTLHLPLCNHLQNSKVYRKMILYPRGHLKTTILKSLALHALIQPGTPIEGRIGEFKNIYFPNGIGARRDARGTNTRILFGSKGADLARSTLSEVIAVIESNPLLKALWPQAMWDDPRRQAKVWNQERIVLPRDATDKEASIETIGVGGQITGYHFNLHIFDDLIDIGDANSPTTMQTAIEWWKASRALMDDPDKTLEYTVGTRWAVMDLYEFIEKNDPTVEMYVRRVIENGEPIFPERYSINTIQRLEREMGSMFPLLYMNNATDPTLTDFDMSRVRRYFISDKKVCFDETTDDMIAEERRELAADIATHGATKPPPRGTKLDRDGWDMLVERNKYLRIRHPRVE